MNYFLKGLHGRRRNKGLFRLVIVSGKSAVCGGFVICSLGSLFLYKKRVFCLVINKQLLLLWLSRGIRNTILGQRLLSNLF